MNRLEGLIGKSVDEIDCEIITSLNEINIKAAILEYKYQNCGRRYPSSHFKLAPIDYNNIIDFKELIYFTKICIIWYYNGIITDLEFFDITDDMNQIKKDYDYIRAMIENNKAHELRLGDTKILAAYRSNEEIILSNDKKTVKRAFVFKKIYLKKILNEIPVKF